MLLLNLGTSVVCYIQWTWENWEEVCVCVCVCAFVRAWCGVVCVDVQCVELVVGLVTSLSASFSRWRARRGAADNNSVVSDQSLLSAISDTLPTAQHDTNLRSIDCNTSLRPHIAATPKMIRKRRADNEALPFSASKKLVCHFLLLCCENYCKIAAAVALNTLSPCLNTTLLILEAHKRM